MGHIARAVEAAGIPTVIIATVAFRPRLEAMTPPRVLLTPFPMGRPLGAPHAEEQQIAVLKGALDLLETAQAPGTIVAWDGPYR